MRTFLTAISPTSTKTERQPRVVAAHGSSNLKHDPTWYKDAVIYEIHVRAFYDSNGDGIGDFPGLTEKLDYLQNLGVTAIWLLPFYPSPLKDDGYDIADYYSINPIYGTLKDFKTFLAEAHQRDLRVITELVVNHTSDQHEWFQKSRRAGPKDKWRDFYVWSDTSDKYKDARIIFRDFETSNWAWDPVANSYFWHRFYSHQPDLNYDNPQVAREITKVMDFWLDMGVDGLRLDAVPYLYEREGTSCENLKDTHDYLKQLRKHVDEKYGDRMLLAEANQWPEDAVSYLGGGSGDECHMAFHFPLMPRLFMAVRMEERLPIVDILAQTPAIPESSQWALFLRNHDELTLEMVTDEERDYMYRVYASESKARINLGIRRRLAPLLGNDRKRIELLHLLLFSFPGTPVLYYGDELGMGDNIFLGDRNGVRTPMQWSSDRNAGFSRASPQALFLPIILDPEYHYETLNAEAQQRNPNSLWWWMKRALTLRKRYQAFGRGSIEFLQPENSKILAFIRKFENETILVVANLSRFSQPALLNLAVFESATPIEIFGRTKFPRIGKDLYALSLSPHSSFWFELEGGQSAPNQEQAPEALVTGARWEAVVTGENRLKLERRLLDYVQKRRWFGGKGRVVKGLSIQDVISTPGELGGAIVMMLLVDYLEGDPQEYLLPLAFASGAEREQLERERPGLVITQLRRASEEGILYDAVGNREFRQALLDTAMRRKVLPGKDGVLKGLLPPGVRPGASGLGAGLLESTLPASEQSNSSILYGNKYFLKLFRRLEPGINPDLEIGSFLTAKHFANSAEVSGSLAYQRKSGEEITLGILTRYVPEAKDAWEYSMDALSRFFERVRTLDPDATEADQPKDLILAQEAAISERAVSLVGTYLEAARLLGQRTGEMHLALASDRENPNFAPEPFTPFYQRSLFQSMRNLVITAMRMLRQRLDQTPKEVRADAEKVAALEQTILKKLQPVYQTRISAMRIRCHGDFHLGQVLYTGKDFTIIDFEGEPARPLGERRIKRSPLRDVAGMIRSFDYIVYAALFKQIELGSVPETQISQLERWTSFWHRWVTAVYLRAYLSVVGSSNLLPSDPEQLKVLLYSHLLEKAAYEVSYEVNNRPTWLKIPLRGILHLVGDDAAP